MYEPTYLGDIELSEETLEHYGVRGMKWRRRKGVSQANRDSDYQYQYDPNTKQRYRVLNMDKLMSKGKYAVKPSSPGVSQVTKGSSSDNRKPRSRRRNVTGSGTGAYRKGSKLGYRVGGR